MRDGFLRRCIKRLALWRFQTDLTLTRRIQILRGDGPRHELRGQCNGCGACCETPSIHLPRILFHLKTARWLMITWHKWVNGFELIARDRTNHILIFRCTHFDSETKQCDSYDSRPGMCRDYPKNQLDTGCPEFFPGCGFYAYAINAREIRESLDELELTEEKRRELERRFYIMDRADNS